MTPSIRIVLKVPSPIISGKGQLATTRSVTNLNIATLLLSATSIPNCHFADNYMYLDSNALACTLCLSTTDLLCAGYVAMFYMYRRLRGRVGGDTERCPKPRPNISPDQPGLPHFSRKTLKTHGKAWVRGDVLLTLSKDSII